MLFAFPEKLIIRKAADEFKAGYYEFLGFFYVFGGAISHKNSMGTTITMLVQFVCLNVQRLMLGIICLYRLGFQ